jgi:hypothetical protein
MKTTIQPNQNFAPQPRSLAAQKRREQIKQTLRQQIGATLHSAQNLPPTERLPAIKTRLAAIQADCQAIAHTFIVVEVHITCDQYGLNGRMQDTATLFRGPSEDASVAICVTAQGSLLHRNGGAWVVYRNTGDVYPMSDRAAA